MRRDDCVVLHRSAAAVVQAVMKRDGGEHHHHKPGENFMMETTVERQQQPQQQQHHVGSSSNNNNSIHDDLDDGNTRNREIPGEQHGVSMTNHRQPGGNSRHNNHSDEYGGEHDDEGRPPVDRAAHDQQQETDDGGYGNYDDTGSYSSDSSVGSSDSFTSSENDYSMSSGEDDGRGTGRAGGGSAAGGGASSRNASGNAIRTPLAVTRRPGPAASPSPQTQAQEQQHLSSQQRLQQQQHILQQQYLASVPTSAIGYHVPAGAAAVAAAYNNSAKLAASSTAGIKTDRLHHDDSASTGAPVTYTPLVRLTTQQPQQQQQNQQLQQQQIVQGNQASATDTQAATTTTLGGKDGTATAVNSVAATTSIGSSSSGGAGAINENNRNSKFGPQHEMEEQRKLNDEVERLAAKQTRALLARLENALPRGKLSLINLARRNLGVEEAKLLKQAISSNPHLSVLKLSYNWLGDEGATIIANAVIQLHNDDSSSNESSSNSRIMNPKSATSVPGSGGNSYKHHPTLSVLDLGFNDIGDKGCEALAVRAVAGNYNLRKLYLSGNQFRKKGAMSIAGAILHGTGLSSLHLSVNRIGSLGMKAIAGAIAKNDMKVLNVSASGMVGGQHQNGVGGGAYRLGQNEEALTRRMEELYLGSTSIDSSGFIAIPGMMLSNSSLRILDLSNNNVDDNDMVLLSQALSQNKRIPLESLRLSFNKISCQGVECLMNSIWGSPTLREIRLDNNNIQDRGAQLCAVVLTSIALEILDLAFNRVTTLGLKALMKNLSENSSLRSLGLCGIPIDQNASKAVSYALAYNTSLKAMFVDNCSTGYSSQRHIVAGIVSNRRSSLRVLTGFQIGPVARTLGMPNLPEQWSNDQVLGFFRLMWQQWLLKAGRGTISEDAYRGPAPPAAVASAAKIALAALGSSPESLFHTEPHEKPVAEGAPVDPSNTALLERTDSGTMRVPSFSNTLEFDGEEAYEMNSKSTELASAAVAYSSVPTVRGPLENPERRNKNLQWLRVHFRSLNEVGRLPFNNADLWQLHQYYFSPPFSPDTEGTEKGITDKDGREGNAGKVEEDSKGAPPPTPALDSKNPSIGRAVSFQALGDAFAASGMYLPSSSNKRRSIEEGKGPAAKKAKSLSKPRIAYYPRVMAKIQSLGTKPMEQSLSLLRQLKYTENVVFSGKDPYTDFTEGISTEPSHPDVEMILLDLL